MASMPNHGSAKGPGSWFWFLRIVFCILPFLAFDSDAADFESAPLSNRRS
jgi:hypothetical protein